MFRRTFLAAIGSLPFMKVGEPAKAIRIDCYDRRYATVRGPSDVLLQFHEAWQTKLWPDWRTNPYAAETKRLMYRYKGNERKFHLDRGPWKAAMYAAIDEVERHGVVVIQSESFIRRMHGTKANSDVVTLHVAETVWMS